MTIPIMTILLSTHLIEPVYISSSSLDSLPSSLAYVCIFVMHLYFKSYNIIIRVFHSEFRAALRTTDSMLSLQVQLP